MELSSKAINLIVIILLLIMMTYLIVINLSDNCKEYSYIDQFNKNNTCKVYK